MSYQRILRGRTGFGVTMELGQECAPGKRVTWVLHRNDEEVGRSNKITLARKWETTLRLDIELHAVDAATAAENARLARAVKAARSPRMAQMELAF